jgi:hypothetical protein
MKTPIVPDKMPCSPVKDNKCFGGINHLQLQGRRLRQGTNMKQADRPHVGRYIPEEGTIYDNLNFTIVTHKLHTTQYLQRGLMDMYRMFSKGLLH